MAYRPSLFTTKPEYYTENIHRASKLRAAAGLIGKPDGATEPAVIIFNGHGFQYALEEAQAYRLADSIADALASHRSNNQGVTSA
ncbi:hypothetical protein [Pseudarthrobacter sp. Y6]|uniref:hypothetical protein n=1 Tax=Pseudarthrobacter sp. Y6 TaxID=3418422 RepID=UPI003CF1453C